MTVDSRTVNGFLYSRACVLCVVRSLGKGLGSWVSRLTFNSLKLFASLRPLSDLQTIPQKELLVGGGCEDEYAEPAKTLIAIRTRTRGRLGLRVQSQEPRPRKTRHLLLREVLIHSSFALLKPG